MLTDVTLPALKLCDVSGLNIAAAWQGCQTPWPQRIFGNENGNGLAGLTSIQLPCRTPPAFSKLGNHRHQDTDHVIHYQKDGTMKAKRRTEDRLQLLAPSRKEVPGKIDIMNVLPSFSTILQREDGKKAIKNRKKSRIEKLYISINSITLLRQLPTQNAQRHSSHHPLDRLRNGRPSGLPSQ
jgi:hypothetical protein